MEPLVDKIKIFTELSNMSNLMETKVNNFIENKLDILKFDSQNITRILPNIIHNMNAKQINKNIVFVGVGNLPRTATQKDEDSCETIRIELWA